MKIYLLILLMGSLWTAIRFTSAAKPRSERLPSGRQHFAHRLASGNTASPDSNAFACSVGTPAESLSIKPG